MEQFSRKEDPPDEPDDDGLSNLSPAEIRRHGGKMAFAKRAGDFSDEEVDRQIARLIVEMDDSDPDEEE